MSDSSYDPQTTLNLMALAPSAAKSVDATIDRTATSGKMRAEVRRHQVPFWPSINPFSIAGRRSRSGQWSRLERVDSLPRSPSRDTYGRSQPHRSGSGDRRERYAASGPSLPDGRSTKPVTGGSRLETGAGVNCRSRPAPTSASCTDDAAHNQTDSGPVRAIGTLTAEQVAALNEVERLEKQERRQRRAEERERAAAQGPEPG